MHIITRKRLNEFSTKYPETKTALANWHPIANFIYVPHTEKEYNHLVELLDSLIDKVGEDENHPLASMMEILGVLIEYYENHHVPELIN